MLVALAIWAAAAACSSEQVRISDRCEALTDPVLLHPLDFEGRFAVGILDEQVLFSFVARTSDPERNHEVRARWFDSSLAPATDSFWLGDARGAPNFRWVAHDGRLWAQIWALPDHDAELPPHRSSIAIYSVAPSSMAFERHAVELPIVRNFDDRPDLTPVSIGASSATAGRQAVATSAVGHGRPVFVLNAIPDSCSHFAFVNAARLFVFDTETEYVNQHGDDPCSAISMTSDEEEHDATLVALQDGGLGVFFRAGALLYYSRIASDLRMTDQPPHLVGSTTLGYVVDGGYQARVAQLDSGAILFTERSEGNSTNVCSNLRLVDPDGRNARFAPWQLPCIPPPRSARNGTFAPWLTDWLAVEPLANGHAILAWGERTNFAPGLEYATRLTSNVEWEEGVFLTTIDGAGRRASEIVRVTSPESTAVTGAGTPRTETTGPFTGEFQVMAASEGDDVVVVWRDLRPDAPGYYGRRYRCGPIAE